MQSWHHLRLTGMSIVLQVIGCKPKYKLKLLFIQRGPWMSVPNFMAIQLIERFDWTKISTDFAMVKRNICHLHLTHQTPAPIVFYEACTPVTSCQPQCCGYSLCLYLLYVCATYWRQLMRIKLRRAPQRCLVALHLRQQFTPVTLKATFNLFRSCSVVSWDNFCLLIFLVFLYSWSQVEGSFSFLSVKTIQRYHLLYLHLFLHPLRLPCQHHLQITSIVLAN